MTERDMVVLAGILLLAALIVGGFVMLFVFLLAS